MIPRLTWSVNTLYNSALRRLPTLVDGKINQLYNSKRYRIHGEKSPKTYEGYLLCGAMSHLVYDSMSIPITKYIHGKGRGKYFEDHMFLKHKEIIIDPTYRQMFRTVYGEGDEPYFKLLYEENPPFFVGDFDALYKLYTTLNDQHQADFGVDLESKMEFYEEAEPYKNRYVSSGEAVDRYTLG